jgi:hypothetical protein
MTAEDVDNGTSQRMNNDNGRQVTRLKGLLDLLLPFV